MMEITVGNYGRMMFEMMLEDKTNLPEHWKNIYTEAKPLVEQLLELNSKMNPNSYKIVGYKDKSGKMVLASHERIVETQKKLWSTALKKIKVGDKIWVLGGNFDMDVCWNEPCSVEMKRSTHVVIEGHCGGELLEKVYDSDVTLLAPSDWNENREKYQNPDYWIEQADKLGI